MKTYTHPKFSTNNILDIFPMVTKHSNGDVVLNTPWGQDIFQESELTRVKVAPRVRNRHLNATVAFALDAVRGFDTTPKGLRPPIGTYNSWVQSGKIAGSLIAF